MKTLSCQVKQKVKSPAIDGCYHHILATEQLLVAVTVCRTIYDEASQALRVVHRQQGQVKSW